MNDNGRVIVSLVEDEALVRLIGTEVLEEAGFEVIEAVNADEAVAILAEQSEVKLLFSDIDMPGTMDGLTLAHVVHERWPDIKLLLTSGKHAIVEEALPDHGRFLPKPWTVNQLISKVTMVLEA